MSSLHIEGLLGGLNAVVTGGAQGLGFASAQLLATAGARVCIADLDAATADAAASNSPERHTSDAVATWPATPVESRR